MEQYGAIAIAVILFIISIGIFTTPKQLSDTKDKCERMVSWVSTFISGISTATSLDDIKAKANAFKTKLAALQSDYTTKCTEVENV